MIQIFIYLTPVVALIALLWSSKIWKKVFAGKEPALAVTSAYDSIKSKPAVQFTLNWRNPNRGKKQDERVFRLNGKKISASESYKKLRKHVFELT
jgi:hypothetical protein